MSAPNFWTMENFPLYVIEDVYSKRCPECDEWNDGDADECEFCGADLSDFDGSYDEVETEWLWEQIEPEIDALNKTLMFHKAELRSGYFAHGQIYVEEKDDPHELDNDDCRYEWDMCRSVAIRKYDAEVRRINRELKRISDEYGLIELVCGGIFSNGEAVYYRADSERGRLLSAAKN